MEKGGMDDADESFKETVLDEQSILRYEEHITELLVTVARLHGKIEHLQQRKDREEEDFSDLGTEYTASLPRCPPSFLSPPVTLPSAACAEEGNADLFLDVDKAITSLENMVFSHRSRIPSAEAELEEYVKVAESLEKSLRKFQTDAKEPLPELDLESQMLNPECLMNDLSGYEREIAMYEERNRALRGVLEDREEEIQKSNAAVCAYQEERDKLHRKTKELQDALSKMETLTEGNASPVREGEQWEFQNPLAHKFIRCFQSATSSTHPMGCHFLQQGLPPAKTWTKDMETQIQLLHGFIKKLKSSNQLLLSTLQECKNDMEWISMLLGQQESNTAALNLAMQYSECCLEALEMLFLLSTKKQADDLSSAHHEMKLAVMDKALKSLQRYNMEDYISEQSFPDPSGVKEDEKTTLQEYIKLLKAERASVKLPTHQPLPGVDSAAARINAGIGAKVAELQRTLQNTLSPEAVKPKMEKGHLLRKLQNMREVLSDLNTTLHLTEKEKHVLELHTYTYRAQETICLLIIRIMQGELDGSWELQSDSSSSSSGDSCSGDCASICTSKWATSGLSQDASGNLSNVDSETRMLELLETWARNRELKSCIRTLLSELEERSQDSRTQERQQMELTRDFFKAHSALVLAYQNARRKQEAQVHQLETQMGLMSQRQAGRLQSLGQIIQKLEGRAENQAPI
ncbi:harmonin-binding protein USHBP1 [Tiliqua scincoides]|uniref:harmonin-binding protein USHBP1 n=1 Tax=Tiliqua scincoides TaxID=71010 RepID=UPI003461B83E